jgi:hypothetical protein
MLAFAKNHPEFADRIGEEASSRMQIAKAATTLKPESFYRDPGSLYTVGLHKDAARDMLHWDKPIGEQSEKVQRVAHSIVQSDLWDEDTRRLMKAHASRKI